MESPGVNATARSSKFATLFQMPEIMLPYLDVIVDPQEVDLVLALDGRSLSPDQLVDTLQMPRADVEALLKRAFDREVVNREIRDGLTYYTTATFYRRVDVIATFEFEKYRTVPAEVRDAIREWYLHAYIDFWRPAIDQIKIDPNHLPRQIDVRISNRDIMLLEEAFEMVDAASLHVMYPCGCQGLVVPGEPPIEASIRLDESAQLVLDRGQGRRVSKDEMKDIIVKTTKAGRLITGLRSWKSHEILGLGLCDPTIGYSFCSAAWLGMEKQWPRVHHLAKVDYTRCAGSGQCVERCSFSALNLGAVAQQGNGGRSRQVEVDAEKCWGCGFCVDVCPESAISMEPLTA